MLLYKGMKKIRIHANFEQFWIFFSLLTLSGSVVYIFYSLNNLGFISAVVINILLSWAFISNLKKNVAQTQDKIFPSLKFYIYFSLALIFSIITIIILFYSRSNVAMVSPWQQAGLYFFVITFISSFFLMLSFRQTANNGIKKMLFCFYLFSIFAVATIIYALGYGFDPHIHHAAISEIKNFGLVLPKTPYYLGQYSLVIFFYKIFGIKLELINAYLLPLGAALALPFIISYLHRDRKNNNIAWVSSLMLILLGFSPFIISTPQNLSYLFLLATVVFAYKNAHWTLIVSSSLASFFIHPLSGVPALLILIIYFIKNQKEHNNLSKLLLKPFSVIITSIATLSLTIWAASGFATPDFNSISLNILLPTFPNQDNYHLNLSYFFIENKAWLISLLLILILFYRKRIWKNRIKKEGARAYLLALLGISVILTYLISFNLKFPLLIGYEQGAYTSRLLLISIIVFLPLFWELFYFLLKKLDKLKLSIQLISAISLSLLLLVSIYSSYPRLDNYHNSRGYSSSIYDLESVILAENLAQGSDYIVLANQQVSAMALKNFGFHGRYLNIDQQEIYFYPIPTSSPLYQYFLDASYKKADRENMKRAMDFAQVNRAYLIVNKYWWASDKIIAEAKMSADNWHRIGQGENYLFEYIRQ